MRCRHARLWSFLLLLVIQGWVIAIAQGRTMCMD
jgi:hypothetical protein